MYVNMPHKRYVTTSEYDTGRPGQGGMFYQTKWEVVGVTQTLAF